MRIRIRFSKTGVMRFVGHLDLQRALERAARRAGLPLKYSQGFNPRAKIQLASALPLGITSHAEIADLWLEEPLPVEEIQEALQRALPPGLSLLSLEVVEDALPSLQSCVHAAVYQITFTRAVPNIEQDVQRVLEAKKIIRQRGNKEYDLRPLILSLRLLWDKANPHPKLEMVLSAREGATGRPEEVLKELGIPPQDTLIHRTALLFQGNS